MQNKSIHIEILLNNNLDSTTQISSDPSILNIPQDESKPLCSFGVLADIQYSDHDDVHVFNKCRYYRNSLNQISNAIDHWKEFELKTDSKLKFILQLGDLIDGKCERNNESVESMHLALKQLNKMFDDETGAEIPKLLHIFGNHEMYNFLRSEILSLELNSARALGQDAKKNGIYYALDLSSKLKLICLDLYEFSVLGYAKTDETFIKANEFIETKLKESKRSGLYPVMNGGVKEMQLSWFENELYKCQSENKKALVCGHCPVLEEASHVKYLALNSDELNGVMGQFRNVVVAYLSGHYHEGGYLKDEFNIHHITVPGVVEKGPDECSIMTANVYEDKIIILLKNGKIE
jgi:manganese-dependent ADP-ribose/CDP-alcohol diphosphatase